MTLLLAGFLACIAGCGGDTPASSNSTLGPGRFSAMTNELSSATPQGQSTAQQAAARAARQTQITQRYARMVVAGDCRRSLTALGRAYDDFRRAALQAATSPTHDDAYAAAAGNISNELQEAEQRCG